MLTDDLPEEDAREQKTAAPFLFTGSFSACIAADMVVYKLGGFVTDQRARLLEVTPQRAVMRLGNRGLLPFWGGSDENRPVELEVEFDDTPVGAPRGGSAQSLPVCVNVRIRPLGWIRNADVFQGRARRVLKELRSFFAAR